MKYSKCPLCNSEKSTVMLELDSAVFDDSSLYDVIYIMSCSNCGHIYNNISDKQYEDLKEYYDQEYAPINLDSPNKTGDMPGSSNKYTLKRFEVLYDFIKSHIKDNDAIVDVGCAEGNFMALLKSKGFLNVIGVDPTITYAENNSRIFLGSAEQTLLKASSVDFLNLDQVLEHVKNPSVVFKEACRVLKDDGIFCISVPDATGYRENYIFDFYWFLLKEHLQHFDLNHLIMLANSEGFDLLFYQRTDSVMMSEKALLPNLTVLFQKRKNFIKTEDSIYFNQLGRFDLYEEIKKYVTEESKKLQSKKLSLKSILDLNKKLYIWGIGREFFYLYKNTDLIGYKNITLIDENIYKQDNYRVDNKIIYSKEILKEDVNGNSYLLITATAHEKEIKKELINLRYEGTVVNI